MKDTRNTVHRTTMSQSPSKQAPWDLTQFPQSPSAALSYSPESHRWSEITSLSTVLLVWGKARSLRAPNLGCWGAESHGWFDVLPKKLCTRCDAWRMHVHFGFFVCLFPLHLYKIRESFCPALSIFWLGQYHSPTWLWTCSHWWDGIWGTDSWTHIYLLRKLLGSQRPVEAFVTRERLLVPTCCPLLTAMPHFSCREDASLYPKCWWNGQRKAASWNGRLKSRIHEHWIKQAQERNRKQGG